MESPVDRTDGVSFIQKWKLTVVTKSPVLKSRRDLRLYSEEVPSEGFCEEYGSRVESTSYWLRISRQRRKLSL